MQIWKHIDILRLSSVVIFLGYGTLILAEREAASYIPLYLAVPALILYFILTPVTFITALIRVLATFTPYFGLAMFAIGINSGVNLYPDIMQFKVFGYIFIGLILFIIFLKLPSWSLNDT